MKNNKIIYWDFFDTEIVFRLNLIEFWIMRRILKKKKYEKFKCQNIKGREVDYLVIDESVKLN